MNQPITLLQLNRRIKAALSRPDLSQVWVVAELVDCRLNRGHFYFDLIEKDPATGNILARLGGVIWASAYPYISAEFYRATGQQLATGLKVMVCGTVNFHEAYGSKFVVSAIDSNYTMGEAQRRRREILERLKREGMLELNKTAEWPMPLQRIAVISAPGAAGFGDFCHQLAANPSRLRFSTKLFPALMQGDRTVPSVIAALEQIAAEDVWDCVVIIRGGGASSDLMAFDNYDLAANIAQFPIPVIVGIGHERDTTVLDYVAAMRVKTPTAAAEFLIGRGEDALEELRRMAADILQSATDRLGGASTQLAYLESTLQAAPVAVVERANARLQRATMLLAEVGARRISPMFERLDRTMQAIATAAFNQTSRAADRLAAKSQLIEALSPQATLNRGYSITLLDGHALTDPASVPPGSTLQTRLARGSITSVTK